MRLIWCTETQHFLVVYINVYVDVHFIVAYIDAYAAVQPQKERVAEGAQRFLGRRLRATISSSTDIGKKKELTLHRLVDVYY